MKMESNMAGENDRNISFLVGKTLSNVEQVDTCQGSGNDGIKFTLEDGREYFLTHYQDCCENVSVEDIAGDLKDLIGTPITKAEESIKDDETVSEYGMWTYYLLATVRGYVNIRFYGSSNGYYAVGVSFIKSGRGKYDD